MGEVIHVQFGQEKHLSDGTRVRIVKREQKREKHRSGNTAKHEARHAVAAELNGTPVVYATNVPGPGYLGLTQLSSFDAVAAAAPHAHGDGGTGHDIAIIKRAGVSVEGSIRTAKNILARAQGQVEAVASAIENKGTVTGNTIRDIMADAQKGPELVMQIIFPNGKTREMAVQQKPANDNAIFIPESELPRAA